MEVGRHAAQAMSVRRKFASRIAKNMDTAEDSEERGNSNRDGVAVGS